MTQDGLQVIRNAGTFRPDPVSQIPDSGVWSRFLVDRPELFIKLEVVFEGTEGIGHWHDDDSVVYCLAGDGLVRHGPGLAQSDLFTTGDMLVIPAKCEHQPVNPSQDQRLVCLVIRSGPEVVHPI